MISHISIRDFAIIEKVEIDLKPGFNIITGETGAGKSIIIEAVNLALGSRADTAFIRTGKEKAVIRMAVETQDPEVLKLLEENGIPTESPIVITRELNAAAKSQCRISGEPVPVSFLSKICRRIADIHGQYDHQSLLDPEHHINYVDSFDEENIGPAKQETESLYKEYTSIKNKLDALQKRQAEGQRKLDFMRFELSEIQNVNPLAGEDTELSERLMILQNSEKIYEKTAEAYGSIFEDTPSALDGLANALKCLREISAFSGEISSLEEIISDCYYKLEDSGSDLRRLRDSISFSQEELNEAMARLDLIDNLKRKYGGTLDDVLAYRDQLAEDLSNVENADQLTEQLKDQLDKQEEILKKSSEKLSSLRKKAAKKMEAQINAQLAELNFKDASIITAFDEFTGQDGPVYTQSGIDKVEFLIITNKGEKPKPLAKIASGGEISRIMLAIKEILGHCDKIPTMIFDEIDTGISGITASIVGKKLHGMAKDHQVICITHLAQIAAFGEHHYLIQKEEADGRTVSTVKPLDESQSTMEIARLLGGINVTDAALKNAEELIKMSKY